MAITRAESNPQLTPASRKREALAAIIDMAAIGVPHSLYMSRAQRTASGRARLEKLGGRWNRASNIARPVLDEQIGSPGVWIIGLRTVDSRTGRRVALWRTLVLALARVLSWELGRGALGVRPPLSKPERADLAREMQAIRDAHADDDEARQLAMMRLYQERRVDVKLGWRWLAGLAGAVFVNHWLRRRLAPTVVVSTRGRATD